MQPNGDKSPNDRRLTVPEAAEALGISEEAVRSRIHSATLRKEKDPDGTVYVRLNGDRSQPNGDDTTDKTADRSAVEEVLWEQVAHLREQLDQEREANRENRRIIAGLVQRVPELEAPRKPRDAPEMPTEAPDRADQRPADKGAQEAAEPRSEQSWWRRWFGFE